MKDRTLRESLRSVGELLSREGLSTVCFVSADLLMRAGEDPELTQALEGMDMLIPASIRILEAGGIRSGTRAREVRGGYHVTELLKRLARDKKKIFLLADSQEELVSLREKLLSMAGRLTFFGSFAMDNPDSSRDAVVNAINSVIPDVIISAANSPEQELLMHGARSMVNARLWISLQPEAMDAALQRSPGFFSSLIDRLRFKQSLRRYGKAAEGEEDNS